MSSHATSATVQLPSPSQPRLKLVEPTERPRAPHHSSAILLFTHTPALAGLDSLLRESGLDVYWIHSLEHASRILANCRGSCAAVVDTTQAAAYSRDALYQLLQATPAVPTLVLADADGQDSRSPWAETAYAEVACLSASPRELLLRIQALLLRAGLAVPASPVAPSPLNARGHVVVLFGLKGGIGRSTIAANLAIGLAQQYRKRVALLNADLWYNAQAALLNLRGDKSIASLAHQTGDLDAESLRDVLVPHASGVQVLLGPPDPVLVETIPPELPARVAAAYREQFDFVVVDTHPSMEEHVLQLLEIADRILLVTTPEVGPVQSTAQVLRLAPQLGWQDKVQLVVNRADAGVELHHLEATLGIPVYARIVSAGRQVAEAANRGQPLVQTDRARNEQFSRDVCRLAALVAGEPERNESPPQSWWRRLLGGAVGTTRPTLQGVVAE